METGLDYITLRARYEVLMEMPIGCELVDVETWTARLAALIADIKRSDSQIAEVMR